MITHTQIFSRADPLFAYYTAVRVAIYKNTKWTKKTKGQMVRKRRTKGRWTER